MTENMYQNLNPNASEEQRDRANKWLRGEVSNYPRGRPKGSRSGTGALSFMYEEKKICKDCGDMFVCPSGVVRCISCRDKIAAKKLLEKLTGKRKNREDTAKCPWCGNIFMPHRRNQVYCKKKCRIEHNNALRIGKDTTRDL